MKNKNLIIGTLAVLLLVSLVFNYKSNETVIKDKVATTRENVKSEVSDVTVSVEKKAKTNYALAKAKVALLRSQVALEIDKSEQKAKEELDKASNYLSEAKETADEKTKAEIDLLKTKVNATKKSVEQKRDDALVNLSDSIDDLITISVKYNDKFQSEKQKNIATINRKYAELKAEEALLKAKIAAQSEKTYTQAQTYLEEANDWYIRSKEYGTQEIKSNKEQIQKDIADAQSYLDKKDKEARNKIADILQKASDNIRKD